MRLRKRPEPFRVLTGEEHAEQIKGAALTLTPDDAEATERQESHRVTRGDLAAGRRDRMRVDRG